MRSPAVRLSLDLGGLAFKETPWPEVSRYRREELRSQMDHWDQVVKASHLLVSSEDA